MGFVAQAFASSLPDIDDSPLVEWAEKNIRFPGSPISEEFRIENIPQLIRPMQAWDDPKTWGVSVLAGVQGCKTGFEQIAVARAIAKRPGNMLVTTQTDAESTFFAKTKLLPCLRESPATKAIMAGLGRDDVTKEHIITPAMFVQIQGPGLSGLQSKTIHYILNDEMWQWKKGTMAEILRRANAVRNKKVLSASQGGEQITNEYGQPDWDEWGAWWHQGTQEHFEVRCQACGKFFPPEMRDPDTGKFILVWDENEDTRHPETKEWNWKSVRETVRMQCPHCEAPIENRERVRRDLIQDWQYRQTNFNNSPGHRSFRYSGLTLWWRDWADIAESFLRAKDALRMGSIEELRAFTQKEEARFWMLSDQEIPVVNNRAPSGYRFADYEPKEGEPVPLIDGEERRFMFVDMQQNRFPVVIRAFGAGKSRMLYCGEVQHVEDIKQLEERYGIQSSHVGFDVGNWTKEAMKFCLFNRWSPMRGRDVRNFTKAQGKHKRVVTRHQVVPERLTGEPVFFKPPWGRPDRGAVLKVWEWSNVYFKDILSRLKVMPDHQIPDDAPQLYIESMESEAKDPKSGIYKQIGKRPNHYWDCEAGITFMAYLYKLVGGQPEESKEETIAE